MVVVANEAILSLGCFDDLRPWAPCIDPAPSFGASDGLRLEPACTLSSGCLEGLRLGISSICLAGLRGLGASGTLSLGFLDGLRLGPSDFESFIILTVLKLCNEIEE